MQNINQIAYKVSENAINSIAKGRLLEAINFINSYAKKYAVNDELYRELIILSMEIHNLEKAIRKGRVSWEEENKCKNKIANNLLEWLEEFKSLNDPLKFLGNIQ